MKYRPEIDGLRAFAVGSVIIFHADFTVNGGTLLAGGGFGVDLFFVISGYLISSLLFNEIKQTGDLKLLNFYERRIRRIFPALMLVILCCVPAVLYISSSSERIAFRDSAAAAILSFSNIYFLLSTIDYDAGSSQLMPLLHTWSLGVEEQFYIFFPVFLIIMLRSSFRIRNLILGTISIVSFGLAVLTPNEFKDYSFYLPFTRFWELLAGTFAALIEERTRIRSIERYSNGAVATIGAMLILVGFCAFDPTSHHPGFLTLLPVIGTSLFILGADASFGIGRFFGAAPFVGIGRISYSAYLWHFPLFAFSRQLLGEPTYHLKLSLIATTLILAETSYRLVERPFRNKSIVGWRGASVSFAVSLIAIISVGTWITSISKSSVEDPGLYAPLTGNISASFDVQAMSKAAEEYSVQRQKFVDLTKLNLLIIGNSHSRSLFNAFEQRKALWPEAEFLRYMIQISCFEKRNVKNWPVADEFFASEAYANADAIMVSTRYRHLNECGGNGQAEKPILDREGLGDLISHAQKDGKDVVVFGPSLETVGRKGNEVIYEPLRKALLLGKRDLIGSSREYATKIVNEINLRTFSKKIDNAKLLTDIESIAERNGVEYVDLEKLFCDFDSKSCFGMSPANERIFSDTNHLTLAGSKFLADRLYTAALPHLLSR